MIEKDLHRTYGVETKHRRLAPLRRVLLAYICREPDIGYTQGMNFMAAMLLRFLGEEDAFWTFVALMRGGRQLTPVDT